MLSQLAKFIVALNSNTHTGQLAGGIVCGLFLGLTPFWSLHNLFILAVVCVVRLNISFTLISLAVFSTLAISIAPSAINLGEQLLHAPSLQDFWTERYQSDIWRLTHFNHTLTLGSFVIALASALPLFVLSYSLINGLPRRRGFRVVIGPARKKSIATLFGFKRTQYNRRYANEKVVLFFLKWLDCAKLF